MNTNIGRAGKKLLIVVLFMHFPYVRNILLKRRPFGFLFHEQLYEPCVLLIKSNNLFCIHPKYFIKAVVFDQEHISVCVPLSTAATGCVGEVNRL